MSRSFLPYFLLSWGLFMGSAGCQHHARPPATQRTADGELTAATPDEALAYLESAFDDKSRLIEIFVDRGPSGALDARARGSFLQELDKSWKLVTVASQKARPGMRVMRITPNMGIRIYPPGSADVDLGQPITFADATNPKMARLRFPDVEIAVYRASGNAQVRFMDPDRPRFAEPLFIISSTSPMEWMDRLLAGKL